LEKVLRSNPCVTAGRNYVTTTRVPRLDAIAEFSSGSGVGGKR